MKILFFIDSLRAGGKERRFLELLKELKKTSTINYEIILLSDVKEYDYSFLKDVRIHSLKRNILKDPFIIRKFKKIIKDFKPDMVHGWDAIGAFHFAPFCSLKGIPFINSSISAAPPLLPWYSKRHISTALSYPFSNLILTNSMAGLKSFRVPNSKGRCVYNGFDMDRVKSTEPKESVKSRLKISNEKIIGMTASFTPMKDYYTFIKAGEKLLQTKKDIVFICVGDGPTLQYMKSQISMSNIKKFLFLGKQKDVDSIVNIFDIAVLSSFSEGISNAIMEYMAFGKPVISSSEGGTSELVVENVTGFLIEPQNANQLVDRINFLLTNPSFANEMGINGRERIKKYFSLKKMVEDTIMIYSDMLR